MEKWFQEIQDWYQDYEKFKTSTFQLPDAWVQAFVKLSSVLFRFQDQAGILFEFIENKELDQQNLSLLENMLRNLSTISLEFKDLLVTSGIDFEKLKGMIKGGLAIVKIIHIAPEGTTGKTSYYGEYNSHLFQNLILITFDGLSSYLGYLGEFFSESVTGMTTTKLELVTLFNLIPQITVKLLGVIKPGQILEDKLQVLQDFQDLMTQLSQNIRPFQYLISNDYFGSQISGALGDLRRINASEILIPGRSYKMKRFFGKHKETTNLVQLMNALPMLPIPRYGAYLGKWTIIEHPPVADSPLQKQDVFDLKVNWGSFVIQTGKKIIVTINIAGGVIAEKGGIPENPSLCLRTSSDPPREFVFTPFLLKDITMGVDFLIKIIHRIQEYGPIFAISPG